MTPTSRRALIVARWRAWLSATAFVAVSLLAFGAWQGNLLARVAHMQAGSWIIVTLVALTALAWQARGGFRPLLAFYDVRHFTVRPPYWLAVLAGGVIALFVASNIDTISAVYGLSLETQIAMQTWGYWLLFAFAFCSVLVWAAPWEMFRANGQTEDAVPGTGRNTRSSATPAATPFATLVAWIQNDQPIGNEDLDLFGHQEIARRIVDRLTSTKPGTDSDDVSQAIVGRLGSGKTSVLHLTRRELERRRRSDIEIIEVQMWPYETARAAVVGIIDRLVEALGEHVNVVSLRGVSGAYAEAISATPGGSVLLAALPSRPEQPAEALAAMDNIARVIGVRYVVWIEDLERFASGDAGDEKLGLVRSLLHGLHHLPSFTVITATTELSHRLDLDKIARYVERVPDLRPHVIRQLCGQFLSQWRQQATDRGCISVDAPIDWPRTEEAYRFARALLGYRAFDVPSAVEQLLTTPRALKQSLRRCDEAWRLLIGEVDLDEMLAMCIVRESLPRAHALIEGRLERLREAPGNRRKEDPDPVLALKDELQKELVAEPQKVIDAVVVLVQQVFSGNGRQRLQGLSVRADHVDYWQRFSALPPLSERARDQRVLRAILTGTIDEALDVLEDDYGGDAAVHLAARLSWERVVPLLVPLVRRRLHASENDWGTDESGRARVPGLVSLWNVFLRHDRMRQSIDDLAGPVGEAIDVCTAGYGLRVLPELELYFFTERYGAGDIELFNPSVAAALKQRVRDGLARDVQVPRLVVDALRFARRTTLLHCVWGVGAVRDSRHAIASEQPFAAWPTFAAVVVDALELNPDTMAQQVASLVFSPVDDYGHELRYDHDVCVARFGDAERVVAALTRSAVRSPYLRAVHTALERWARAAFLRALRGR